MKSFLRALNQVIFAFLVVSAFSPSAAKAEVYIEPMIGYLTGSVDYQINDSIAVIGGQKGQNTVSGFGYGAGVGYKLTGGIRFGADVHQFNLETKSDTTTTKSSEMIVFGIVGYEFKKDFTAYFGGGSFTSTSDGDPQTKLTGVALKLGVMHRLHRLLLVNIEGVLYTPDESTTGTAAPVKISDYYSKFNSTAVVANLRIPVEF